MKNRIRIIWQRKTFILLFFGFILFTVIGTLTHECGHYASARFLGYKGGKISYGYTKIGKAGNSDSLINYWKEYAVQIKNGTDFAGRKQFETLRKKAEKNLFIVDASGPLETILTGTIGLLLLIFFRRKFLNSTQLNFWQWITILVALFWLRGSFNLIARIGFYLITGNEPTGGDEFNLSKYLGLGTWTLLIASAIAGIFVLTYIIFKIIPIRQRFTFICAGLSGGLTGAILWLGIVGPRVMP